jgi:hypothetical protein
VIDKQNPTQIRQVEKEKIIRMINRQKNYIKKTYDDEGENERIISFAIQQLDELLTQVIKVRKTRGKTRRWSINPEIYKKD